MPGAPDLAVPVRFTRSEMWLIAFGLRLVDRDYKYWQAYRASEFDYPISVPVPTPIENDTIEQMAAIASVLNLVRNNSQATRRFHLNAFELAACALGVRITCLQARKKKGARWVRRNHRATVSNLLIKLENRRRAAKLLHIRTHGKEHYHAARSRWQRHIEWMHKVFANAFQLRVRAEPNARNELRKTVVMQWVKWVTQQLTEQKLDLPPEAEIVKEVRKILRATRRAGYGYLTLVPGEKGSGVDRVASKLRKSIVGGARMRRKMEIWDKLCAINPWIDMGDADGKEDKAKIQKTEETPPGSKA